MDTIAKAQANLDRQRGYSRNATQIKRAETRLANAVAAAPKPTTCPNHNGTYSCSLEEGHTGMHQTIATGSVYYVFADNYSTVSRRVL